MKPWVIKLIQPLILLFALILPLGTEYVFRFSRESNYLNLALYASDLAVLALIFLVLLGKLGKKPSKIYAFLIFGIILSVAFTPRGENSYFAAIKWVELIILAVTWGFLANRSAFRHVTALGLAISGLLQTLLAAAQFMLQHSVGLWILGESRIAQNISGVAKIDLGSEKLIRAYGTFSHPNQLAAFLVVACATTIYLLDGSKTRKQTILFGLLLFILVIGEFLTVSRAGIAALLLMLAISGLLHVKHKLQFKITAAITGVAIIFSITSLFPLLLARTATQRTEFTRSFYNKIGFEIFQEHPLAGTGIGNLIPQIASKINASEIWQIQPPHIFFLDVACETGIIGLGLILYLFGSRLFWLYKTVPDQDREASEFKIAAFSSFVAILFLMFFDHYFYTLQQTQLLLWMMIGIISYDGPMVQWQNRAFALLRRRFDSA